MQKPINIKINFFSTLILSAAIFFLGCAEDPGKKESLAEEVRDSLKNTDQTYEKDQALNTIEDIQRAYSDIESKIQKRSLDSVILKYNCNGEKSGSISYFSEDSRLRLIVHRYSEYDHFTATDRYYVKDSTLFFADTRNVTWSFESGPEGSTKDNFTEMRTYVVNEKPIKCLEKRFSVRSQAVNNPSSETTPNREITCVSVEKVLKPYLRLLNFKGKSDRNCLENE